MAETQTITAPWNPVVSNSTYNTLKSKLFVRADCVQIDKTGPPADTVVLNGLEEEYSNTTEQTPKWYAPINLKKTTERPSEAPYGEFLLHSPSNCSRNVTVRLYLLSKTYQISCSGTGFLQMDSVQNPMNRKFFNPEWEIYIKKFKFRVLTSATKLVLKLDGPICLKIILGDVVFRLWFGIFHNLEAPSCL